MSNKELLNSRNRWHGNLTKDLYVEEGVRVLEMLNSIKNKSDLILVNIDSNKN